MQVLIQCILIRASAIPLPFSGCVITGIFTQITLFTSLFDGLDNLRTFGTFNLANSSSSFYIPELPKLELSSCLPHAQKGSRNLLQGSLFLSGLQVQEAMAKDLMLTGQTNKSKIYYTIR